MRAAMILSVLLASMRAGAWSQMEWSGRAHVIDGDSLYVGHAEVRLFGIDSPEYEQRCELADGGSWACDEAATSLLKRLAQDRTIACKSEGLDRHDRMIATCWADGVDLGGQLVADGLSWAYRQYSMRYVRIEDRARAAGRGIWRDGSRPSPPWVFRAERRAARAAVATPG